MEKVNSNHHFSPRFAWFAGWIFILAAIFVLNPNCVSAEEEITSFDSQITINPDSSMRVEEAIDYDFGTAMKHGIFRTIPVKYKARGGNYNLRISDITVRDETGAAYPFTTSYMESNVEIKIGDPDRTISGEHQYVIGYTIKRAVNFFSDHDELYWNVTGNEWPVAIGLAKATLFLPNLPEGTELQNACYSGYFGSNVVCSEGQGQAEENKVLFSTLNLGSNEGMTIVVGWPKGITREPTTGEKIWDIVKDNYILFLPFLVFGLMFWLWHRKGRDPEGRGTIIAEFDAPDNLSPAEVGTVFDEKVNDKDISAELIYLAINGYLRIVREEKKGFIGSSTEYVLEQLKESDEKINQFQKDLLNDIFSYGDVPKETSADYIKKVALGDLKDKFASKLAAIRSNVYDSVTKKGYFDKNPQTAPIVYIILGIVFIIVAFIWAVNAESIFIFLAMAGSGVIVIIFGAQMARKSRKGVLAREHILGLKEYLNVTEKDRIKFHNAPEKSPKVFEKFLPYAMVLGVEKEWAKQFEDIYKEQPDWYRDPSGSAFNSVIFASSLNSFSSSAYTSMTTTPSSASSGGSGFSGGGSGGGFGGGGGGSW